MKTKAELLGELSELAEQHKLELPPGLKQLQYPAVAELLEKLQAQVAGTPAPEAPAAPATPDAAALPEPEQPAPGTDAPPVAPAVSDATQPPETPPAPPAATQDPPAPEAPAAPLKLPPGHKRPTLKEFVKAGYLAENYDAHMAEWEAEVAAKFANVPRYVVAPGRSLCGARGMLGPGAPVREDDFTGESKLEDFVRAGYVVAEA